jgi:CelD/BcsL family acetyltransferase involved in cellulose biosynthesis
MKIHCLPARELSADLVDRWNALQTANRKFESPFFRAEYTQAVARERDDVEVAVLEQDGQPAGFWSFQRGPGNVARPVGGGLTDYQGVVLRDDVVLDAWQLLAACRLSAWHFDHLVAEQSAFVPFHWSQAASPQIDLAGGYEMYLAGRRAAQASAVMQTIHKAAKSERQLGPVRFELQTTDRGAFEAMLKWKSQQYAASGVTCPFSFRWTMRLLEQLLAAPADGAWGAMMSALYFGERLAAVHLGLRTDQVVHWWFPTYDSELGKYSPGSQLLLALVRELGPRGVERIDLGKGPETYKQHFMTGARTLAEGSIDSRAMARAVRRTWHQAHHWVRDSRLRGPMMAPWRLIRQVRDRMYFR